MSPYFPGPASGGGGGFDPMAADILGFGSTIPRASVGSSASVGNNGESIIGYLTAVETGDVNNIGLSINSLGTVPVDIRVLVYEVDANDSLTSIIGQSANLSATFVSTINYTVPLSSPAPVVAGQRYAVSFWQDATTLYTVRGVVNNAVNAFAPRIGAIALASLPAPPVSVAAPGGLGSTTRTPWFALLP